MKYSQNKKEIHLKTIKQRETLRKNYNFFRVFCSRKSIKNLSLNIEQSHYSKKMKL
jgi:hypothetical protein